MTDYQVCKTWQGHVNCKTETTTRNDIEASTSEFTLHGKFPYFINLKLQISVPAVGLAMTLPHKRRSFKGRVSLATGSPLLILDASTNEMLVFRQDHSTEVGWHTCTESQLVPA